MADEIPQWAKERANALATAERGDRMASGIDYMNALARYVASVEEEPVDPLLIEARAFAHGRGWQTVDHNGGDAPMVRFALAALRRGIELGKAGEA